MIKLPYIYLLFLFIISCKSEVREYKHSEEMSIHNKTLEYLNSFSNVGDYRFDVDGGLLSWERFGTLWKKDTIKYYINYLPLITNKDTIRDYFTNDDKKYIKFQTLNASKEWAIHINKVVQEVDCTDKSDFDILWKPLENDGKGKRLAVSDGPPDIDMETKPIMIMDLVDMFTIVKNRDEGKYRYYNVILHELGHMLAGLAHDNSVGVMNSAFNFNKLQLDDICGARIIYNNIGNFVFNNTEYMHVSKVRGEKYISAHFKEKEFISKCSLYEGRHFIAKDLIDAIEYIRGVYKTPIQITSSYRDTKCNHNAGGALMSQHLFMNALDWKFVGTNASLAQKKYFNDIISKKNSLNVLLRMNIRGFGSYTHNTMLNHIDVRKELVWNTSYNGIGYMTWGRYKGAFETGDEFKEFD